MRKIEYEIEFGRERQELKRWCAALITIEARRSENPFTMNGKEDAERNARDINNSGDDCRAGGARQHAERTIDIERRLIARCGIVVVPMRCRRDLSGEKQNQRKQQPIRPRRAGFIKFADILHSAKILYRDD